MFNKFSVVIVLILLRFFTFGFAEPLPPLEQFPVLKAQDLVPADMLKGMGYSVDSQVSTKGYLGNFTLNTSWGPLKIRGVDLLKVRILEVPAMQQLDEVSKTEVFAKALANAAITPIQNIAQDPVGTVKGIPAGVGRFFKRAKKTVEKGVEAAKNSGDESQAGGQSSSSALQEVAGFNQTKREWAQQLQVDPYTTNPTLKKQLHDIAWATFAGKLTVRAGLRKAPREVRTVIRISNLVWTMPPQDLKELNTKKMKVMGAGENSITAFFKNPFFTPTLQTSLVSILEELVGVEGRPAIISHASTAESEEEARFLIGSLTLLKNFHNTESLKSLGTTGSLVTAMSSKGSLVVGADLDYVPWTQEVREFGQRNELRFTKRLILLSGRFSPVSRKALSSFGWQFRENSPMDPTTRSGK